MTHSLNVDYEMELWDKTNIIHVLRNNNNKPEVNVVAVKLSSAVTPPVITTVTVILYAVSSSRLDNVYSV